MWNANAMMPMSNVKELVTLEADVGGGLIDFDGFTSHGSISLQN